jgi:hypothetical protein
MSLTLRDAQHLSWKTFKKLEVLNQKTKFEIGTAFDLQKRVEEIVQTFGVNGNSAPEGGSESRGRLLSELLFSILVLAERSHLSLEESFLQTVDDIILKFVC